MRGPALDPEEAQRQRMRAHGGCPPRPQHPLLLYIGGNDSAESAYLLHQVAQSKDYDLRLFHVPKTIDNDLEVTDHCPGYPSAARFVTQAFMGDNEDNRSLGGSRSTW
ncbi:MAG: 6-phosphofructokinase [Planctomycetota bacterium]